MQLERPMPSLGLGSATSTLTAPEVAAAAHFATVVLRVVECHATSAKPDSVEIWHRTDRSSSVPYFYGDAQRHFGASPLDRIAQNDSAMIAAVNAGLAGTGITVKRGFMNPGCELGHGALVDVYGLQVAINTFAFGRRGIK